jgi:repressor LexA
LHFGTYSAIVVFGCSSVSSAGPFGPSQLLFTAQIEVEMPLTKRQREILTYLQAYSEENGYAPSFDEIARQFNYNSLATVHEHLTNLERKGYIKRSYNESRAINILPSEVFQRAVELPLHGRVAAGVPIEAIQGTETIAVPEELIRRRGEHYVLKVKGSSMIDEQVRDGDFVIVNERRTADNGEMVIALLNGNAATMKRFYRERDGRIRLQPANETMTPMYVHENDILVRASWLELSRKY